VYDEEVIDLIDAALAKPTLATTRSELLSFRTQLRAGVLENDDRRYVVALCKRMLRRPSEADPGPDNLAPAPHLSRSDLANSFGLGPVSGCLVSVAVLVVLLLFFYGIVVIVFREAFGVELPNPFGLLRRR
jgi:hypothetical protein